MENFLYNRNIFIIFCLFLVCTACVKEKKELSISQAREKMMRFWANYSSMQNDTLNFFARYRKNYTIIINSARKWTNNNPQSANKLYTPNQKIGNWLIVENLSADNFPTLYYDFHNIKTPDYYFWYPIDFGAYVLEHDTSTNYLFDIDTTLSTYTFSLENAKHTKLNYGKIEALNSITLTSVKNRKNEPFTIHSLKSVTFFTDLKNIIDNSDCKSIQEVNKLCQILQTQYNFSRMNPSARKYILSLDTLYNGQKFIQLWFDSEYILPTYQCLDTKNFDKLGLVFADYTVDSLIALKKYMQIKKPQLIYLKSSYRTSYCCEPYYYFIFYYIDFMPFMSPRLRDIEIIFPRRFGLS